MRPQVMVYNADTMPVKKKSYNVKVDGHQLELSHLDKVFWPKEGYTKGDVIEYYNRIAPYILPYLKDRPESMNRHPNGIKGQAFFQKDTDHQGPEWLTKAEIYSESNNKNIRYLVCNDKATLLYMANLGCIEINPWNSTVKKQENPDFMIIDLDPEGVSFDVVIDVAKEVKKVCDELGIPSYPKTSGATGIHVYVPMGAKYDYEAVKEFAHLIVTMVNKRMPKVTTLERSLKKRPKGVYLDYLQNRRGQTLACVYSLRPKPGAPVSTPLKWTELKHGLKPTDFNIKNIEKRLKKVGDLWKPVMGNGVDMKKVLGRLEK